MPGVFSWWAFLLPVSAGAAVTAAPVPTFYGDVLPVLQRHCQACHRPGEAAPMPLLTYQQVRPWAKAIRESVSLRRMPPWFADPAHGRFANDRRLSDADMATLVTWASNGAPEGDRKQAPPPARFVEGWNIGTPDVEFAMATDFHVPATGTVDYQYIVVPTHFTEDRWIRMAEVRPGNRQVVHHVIAFVRPPGSQWLAEARPGEPFVPRPGRRNRGAGEGGDGMAGVELLVGYAPGMDASVWPAGQAKLVRAGSDLVFQMHYTPSGKATTDRTRIGLVFSQEAPRERVYTVSAINSRFVIPPGAPNHEVTSSLTFHSDVRLVGLMPHMHLRGKDFLYRAVYPTGESEVLLSVPRYNFNWQLWYMPAGEKVLPAGTRVECVAHFDNSPNNPANPDAGKEVRWGDQSWEEMMIGWMDVAFDARRNPQDLFRRASASGAE